MSDITSISKSCIIFSTYLPLVYAVAVQFEYACIKAPPFRYHFHIQRLQNISSYHLANLAVTLY